MNKTKLSVILLTVLFASFIISLNCYAQCDYMEPLYGLWNFDGVSIDLNSFDNVNCGISGTSSGLLARVTCCWHIRMEDGYFRYIYDFTLTGENTVSGTYTLIYNGQLEFERPFNGIKTVDYELTTTSIETTSSTSSIPSSTSSSISGTTSSIRPSTTTTVPGVTTSTSISIDTTSTVLGTYFISGTVRGDVRENITIKLTGTAKRDTITDIDGNYMFSDLPNGYYTITPDNVDFDFEPPNYVIQTLTGDTPDMDFVATKFMPCVLEAIYGDDSEEVELLRLVRDNFMSKTPEGRELIKLYYLWSPVIVKAMEQDEGFKEEVKQMIDGVLPMIEDARE